MRLVVVTGGKPDFGQSAVFRGYEPFPRALEAGNARKPPGAHSDQPRKIPFRLAKACGKCAQQIPERNVGIGADARSQIVDCKLSLTGVRIIVQQEPVQDLRSLRERVHGGQLIRQPLDSPGGKYSRAGTTLSARDVALVSINLLNPQGLN